MGLENAVVLPDDLAGKVADDIASDLSKFGTVLDSKTATAQEFSDAIQATVLARLKDEIMQDPDAIGYAGKTDDEVLSLLYSGKTEITKTSYKVSAVGDAADDQAWNQVTVVNMDDSKADMSGALSKQANFPSGSLQIKEAFDDRISFSTNFRPLPVAVNDAFDIVESVKVIAPRAATVLTGVPHAPNVLTSADVTEARK